MQDYLELVRLGILILISMFQDLCGNLLVLQCGGLSPVSNAVLAEVVSEALNHEDQIEEIFGVLNGVDGIFKEDFIDLAAESQQTIRGLKMTPGAAMGAGRGQLKDEGEADEAFRIFEERNIRYVIVIGDQEALSLVKILQQKAQEINYPAAILMIPVAFDNSLPMTDHCLGYGSVAKTIATAVRQIGLSARNDHRQSKVILVEVPGQGGWVASAATFARRRNHSEDAPHLIYIPEAEWDDEGFVANIEHVVDRHGYCVVVYSENLVNRNKEAFVATQRPGSVDLFKYLSDLLHGRVDASVELIRLGEVAYNLNTTLSLQDLKEAEIASVAAIEAAIAGKTGRMVTLLRAQSQEYACETGLTAIEDFETDSKPLPENWISDDQSSLNHAFIQYLFPLVQGEVTAQFENGVTKMAHLDKRRVFKPANV